MSALRRIGGWPDRAWRCCWDCGTCMAETILWGRAALWLLLLATVNGATFSNPALVRIVPFSSRDVYIVWCGAGLALVAIAILAGWRWLHFLGLLWQVFWWVSIFRILSIIAPGNLLLADSGVSAVGVAWVAIRYAEEYFPERIKPWLRRHPNSPITRASTLDEG